MRVAIDVSPLKTGNYLSHRVRGTGFYLTNLLQSLREYYPQNDYIEFSSADEVPSKVDLIHYPYFEPYFRTLPSKMPVKSVVTVHDLTPFVFPKNFPSGLRGKLKWNQQKRSLKIASAIITDSNASKKDIIKFTGIPTDKISEIYLAPAQHFKKLQPGDWKSEIVKKYDLPEKFALYVGDATWNKNLPNLIKASTAAGMPLIIVGDAFLNKNVDKSNPWTEDLVEAQGLVKNNKNISALGFVPDEDLVRLYNLAVFLLMPSRYEGFGLPLVEAMKSGCPIITSDRGSIKEVVGDCAIFVEPEEINSIRAAVNKLASDLSLRQSLSKNGIKRSTDFSWELTTRQTIRAYERVINE